MNVPRRIAALKREIEYRQAEIERTAEMRAQKEPAVIAFPDFVAKHLADMSAGIEQREAEILRLERTLLPE